MCVIVQKYGGSSLAGIPAIRRCAERAVRAHRAGNQVVVVVSAMGDTTDELTRLARQITGCPHRPTMDLLLAGGEQRSTALMAMAIQSMGVEAVPLVGWDLGIITSDEPGQASIKSVDAAAYRHHLEAGRIVVAAGFQGVTRTGDLTTLGRGGSDITAVAIAAALEVGEPGGGCEIFTDVEGVFTADPGIVPDARLLRRIDARHLLELTSRGAGVVHSRAVSLAMHRQVPLRIASSTCVERTAAGGPLRSEGVGYRRERAGTIVDLPADETLDLERPVVVGCTLMENLARVSMTRTVGQRLEVAAIVDNLRRAGIGIEDLTHQVTAGGVGVSFTLAGVRLEEALASLGAEFGERGMRTARDLALVSGVGSRLQCAGSEYSVRVYKGLEDAGIDVLASRVSDRCIACLVSQSRGREALRLMHDVLGLGKSADVPPGRAPRPQVEFPRHPAAKADQVLAETA